MMGTIILGLAAMPVLICGGWLVVAQWTRAVTAARIAEFDEQLSEPWEVADFYTIRYPRFLSNPILRGQPLERRAHIIATQFVRNGDTTGIPVLTISVSTVPPDGIVVGSNAELALGGMEGLKNARQMRNVVEQPLREWEGQEFTFWRVDFTADVADCPIHGFLMGAREHNRFINLYALCRDPPDSDLYRLLEVSAATCARKYKQSRGP